MLTLTRPRTIAVLPPLITKSPAERNSTSRKEPFPGASFLPPMPVDRRELSFILDPRHGHGTSHGHGHGHSPRDDEGTYVDPRPFVSQDS